MNKKIFFKVNEFYNDVQELRENGVHRGVNIGFHTLDEYYTKKLGGTTYIYSAPFIGKSMFAWELALNSASNYGWITAVYSPESGTKEEQVAELVFKLTGKELYAKHRNAVDEETLKQALGFIQDYFIFIDPDVDRGQDIYENAILTVTGFYKCVNEAENYYGIQIQESLIDPFNELTHNFEKDEGRQDLYIERILGLARRDAKINNRHNTIVTHIVDQAPIQKDGLIYYPPPTARQIAGGQAWYRKGLMMIGMWKPPFGLKNAEGMPYMENEIHIIIQKAKPRYCGKKGNVILYYDTEIGRYYELINNKKYYAFEYQNWANKLQKEGQLLIN